MILEINNKIYQIKQMDTFLEKLKGNMFKKNINEILIFKTNAIHTFFCLKQLDIIMLDKDYKVKYIYKNFQTKKIIFPKKDVKYTLELPVNKIENIKVGDILTIKNK